MYETEERVKRLLKIEKVFNYSTMIAILIVVAALLVRVIKFGTLWG